MELKILGNKRKSIIYEVGSWFVGEERSHEAHILKNVTN